MIRDGDDRQSGDLRERQYAVLDNVTRPPGPVGRYCDVIAAFNHRHQFSQSLCPTSARRTADRLHAEALEHSGEKCAVPAGADKSGQSRGLEMAVFQDGMQLHGKGQAIVPHGKDGLRWFRAKISGAIFMVEANRRRYAADEKGNQRRHYVLVPFGLVRDDNARLAILGGHHVPFFRQARTRSSTVAFGPAAGLEIVDELLAEPSLKTYHLLPSVRGDSLFKLRRFEEAQAEFARAAALTRNARERTLLLGRARECGEKLEKGK